MKRIFLIAILSYSCITNASEKGKVSVGIKFSPSMAFSRVSPPSFNDITTATNYQYEAVGAKLRFAAGVTVDYMIDEYYGISTGLNFILNGSGYRVNKNNAGFVDNIYSIQYIQLPLLFKLQTGEIIDNMRVFFKTGASVDLLIGAQINGKKSTQNTAGITENSTDKINLLHSSLIFSPGVELSWKAGIKFVFGITYSRGITNVDKSANNIDTKVNNLSFDMNNDFISLDLGVKF